MRDNNAMLSPSQMVLPNPKLNLYIAPTHSESFRLMVFGVFKGEQHSISDKAPFG